MTTLPPLFALWLWLASAPSTMTLLDEYPDKATCEQAKREEGRRYKATGGAHYLCLPKYPRYPTTNEMLETE